MSEILTPQIGDDLRDERPRLVLDTNTVLALWMFRDPKLEGLRAWIEAGKCRLYSREDALEELKRVLAYRQFEVDRPRQESIIAAYRAHAINLQRASNSEAAPRSAELPCCRDPDDQKFLELTAAAHATYLLTRDKALLKLARHRLAKNRFSITTPEDFAAQFRLITRLG